jgi:IclR family transcriptional regulator, KDG regulon repressor
MSEEKNHWKYSSQVLDRVVGILDCFTHGEPELSFGEIQSRLNLHKSTLYRLIEAMRSHRILGQAKETGKYHPGLRLFELGTLAVGRLEISECATPALRLLAEETGETAHLCILEGAEVVYVAKVESKQTLRMPSNVGRRNPAYCTGVGKAILAHLTEEEIEDYFKRTPLRSFTKNTIVKRTEIRKQLKEIRARGYSVDDEEISEGLRCVGAPIRDSSGEVIAGISVAGPTLRISEGKIPELGACVVKAANSISEQFGFRLYGKPKMPDKKLRADAVSDARLQKGRKKSRHFTAPS